SLWFEGNSRVSIREDEQQLPAAGEVLLTTIVSAVSAGTEMLFYRGDLEEGAQVDAFLEGYRRPLAYPLRYGYACVGSIAATGEGVDPKLKGRLAFAFAPHATSFCLPAEQAFLVPEGCPPEEAAFLANTETAVNLVLDAAPLFGERISVFGLGVIGLLTVGLLARFPLACLSAWDLLPLRREMAASLGAHVGDPIAAPPTPGTEDCAVEVSGSPQGFSTALSSCRFNGRLVVGSWYGASSRRGGVDGFDTVFHRNRVRIIPSQVSTIDPALSGRWTRTRRLEAAWDAIRMLRPARLITHRIPFCQAADAYRLISDAHEQSVQVMLVHQDESGREP
ncbi:MAG TPA: zinc-binding alcohol dehydrogenase, partial [Spirochaetia bacterium]|nr:zinc-binding alcohol dehydrogenase [Spirochaetia bacterium]